MAGYNESAKSGGTALATAETEIQPKIPPGVKITEGELMRLPKDWRKWELVDGRLTEVSA